MIILCIELIVFVLIVLLFNYNNKFIWCLLPQFFGICLSAVSMLLYSFKLNMYYHTYSFDKSMFMMLTQMNLSPSTLANLYHFGIALILLSNVLTFFIFSHNHKSRFVLIISIIYYLYVNNPATNFRWYIASQTSQAHNGALFTMLYLLSNIITVVCLVLPVAALVCNAIRTKIIGSRKTSAIFALYFLIINLFVTAVFLRDSFINIKSFAIVLNEFFIPHISAVNLEVFPKFFILILAVLLIVLLFVKPFRFFVFNWKGLFLRRLSKFRKASDYSLKMIFHKYKNIFAAIDKFSQLGKQRLSPEQTGAAEIFDTISNISTESLYDIKQIISTFDDMLEVRPTVTDILHCIDNAISFVGITKSSVVIHTEENFNNIIYCDKALLTEAISNILKNSLEALNSTDFRPVEIDVFNELTYAVINITDYGVGISKSNQRHIFAPFFSTKAGGSNQGLGLSFAKKVIELHNGTIYVRSKKNFFTTFQIVLPLKYSKNKSIEKGLEYYAV